MYKRQRVVSSEPRFAGQTGADQKGHCSDLLVLNILAMFSSSVLGGFERVEMWALQTCRTHTHTHEERGKRQQ